MPIGMSFWGFLPPAAGVDPAWNPIWAKTATPPPATTPSQPKCPCPSAAGMNGCQLAGFTACAANTMNSTTTASLMKTMTLLVVADSLMPMTSSVVTRAMMTTAGRLNTAVMLVPSAHLTTVPRAPDSAHGTSSPTSCRNDTTYPDQPIATVTAPRAYSSTRSHPMIQAKISPSVA